MNLTDKQKKFCEEYLIDLNATQAAIRAGYSEKTAYSIASENLIKPEVQEYIQDRQKELQAKTEVTQMRVLKELARVAFLDIRKFYDDNGKLKQPHELDDDAAAALAGIDVTEEFEYKNNGSREQIGWTKKVKLHNKLVALDSLAKHLGMYKDGDSLPDEIKLTLNVK
jgi:phage terminase small subunit